MKSPATSATDAEVVEPEIKCVKWGCNYATVKTLEKGQTLQTSTGGFVIARFRIRVCPVCSGSY
jgi:hypothetical protein